MPNNISRLLLLAPLIFVCHFLEESPTFVEWFNAHVDRGITPQLFWSVNIAGLIITLILVGLEWTTRSSLSLILVIAWLGFLMFANGLFHVVAAIVDRRYMPGLITAVLLYLPYYFWLFVRALRSHRVNPAGLTIAVVLAAIPMLSHGYLIVFQRSRLF